MYAAETGIMFPYFSQEFDHFSSSHKPNASLGIPNSLIRTSAISDYNLGGEGDLFKAPEPVIGEAVMSIDPMTAAMSMISCGEDVISPHSLTVSDIESSIESGQLVSEVFYECRKDLLAKQRTEKAKPFSQVPCFQIPCVKLKTDENVMVDEKGACQKSISSSCQRSMDPHLPRFLDFPDLDFGGFNGLRRAFSEGDIKTLDNDNNTSLKQSKSSCTSEERWDKLSRYWNKKSKRNFGRKIKYACRKALADSQPRIRGRFAKTEEVDSSKMQYN